MVRRHMPRWWWFMPSTGNWSLSAQEIAKNYEHQPSKWPKNAIYQTDYAEDKKGMKTTVYGPGTGPEASRLLAQKFQDKYEAFYQNTNLTSVLGCDPLKDKVKFKSCNLIS